ncbi:uncharacterized protein [Halyomorpha halys]|uniref:uncharacterized protein isoform X2 n=1 Tax=Halyomorpha halys TaxID=286706 RepID=UPI0006D527FF|nr:uncharacterized protein LOC106683965 isoform X2 [Halyomorpha halys]
MEGCIPAMDGNPVMQFVGYSAPPYRSPSYSGLRKYVFLCSVCGGLASLLGGLFLGVYVILRTYTSSLGYFETIPTYIPAAMLLLTGLGIMCLARRKNRYALLIKVCGVCCLMCAGTCIMVTVTTTVIHMSRLQSLRECVYTTKTLTCTCYSILLSKEGQRPDDGAHYVFNSTPNCEVIHGALYSCLRAMFGLSVIGILVCIFCCMLVYQLLSHERKKMYWEQLELRCRYLYGQPRNQPVISPPQRCSHCACSQQFSYPQATDSTFENRQWTGGRIGNLYSPNPEPVSTGWGWRLPWSRDQRQHQEPSRGSSRDGRASREGQSSGADSQYGFSEGGTVGRTAGLATVSGLSPWGPPPPYSDPNSPRRQHSSVNTAEESQVFSPRVKYLREKRPELSESEVYFADVSSCCNGSIRNDSLVYDEPQERTKTNHRFPNIPEERASPDSEVAEDGSEEDDPELVSFSRRNNLTRSHRNRLDLSQATEDFSQMSVDSVGQADSPWGSPDFLAPDAQYETIPEPIGFNERRPPTRDNFTELNGNKQPVDRCNNPHYYGGEYQSRYTNPDGLLRHHYEEIQEPPTQRISETNIGNSPVFGSRLFPNPPRRHSPECIALVDESLCSHNDSSCRCSMSINSRVEDNVPN